MKKKTRSRLSSNLLIAFLTAIAICCAGASVSSVFFVNNYFKTLSKLNEEPIATISFKYKTAQRKFLDRTVWDRLKQDSYLYNGDTIHTADLSEATVTFNDGNKMLLGESTMAQIFLKEGETASASLLDGELGVDSSNASGGFILSYGNSTMTLESGSSINAAGEGKGKFRVQVLNGSASVQNEAGQTQSMSAGEALDVSANSFAEPQIIVTEPAPNAKIVYHTEGNTNVNFSWKAQNIPPLTTMLFEISEDKKFSKITNSVIVNSLNSVNFSLSPKTHYWRIRLIHSDDGASSGSEEFSISSKVSITQALNPELVTPVQNYEYSYRTKKPAVRFIWSEVPLAQSYRLCISRNADMSNVLITQRLSSPSCIISTLDQGTYYWQVTPYFAVNNEGYAAPSAINSFDVQKKGNLMPPILMVPSSDGIVNIEASAKNTSFSWKMDYEAQKYRVLVADNPQLASPVFDVETTENFVSLKTASRLKEGRWYWGVSFVDYEGNPSPRSEVRSFYALKGNPEQRTIEPGDGFRVSENLLPDLNFTWRKNLPETFTSKVQISTDANFSRLVYEEEAGSYSLTGLNLPVGTYWWRLHSENSKDGAVLDTPAKTFVVLGPLANVVITEPVEKAIARETKRNTISWAPVADADFYKVEIFRVSTGEKVYSDNLYETSTQVEMFFGAGFVDKEQYRIEIQARTNAVPGVGSRRVGRISESYFQLVKLKPVEIVSPVMDEQIEGVEAALNKIRIEWNAVDSVREAQVVVYRVVGEEKTVVAKVPEDDVYDELGNLVSRAPSRVAPKTVYIANPNLSEGGNYEIIVFAKTMDGIDISNTDPKRIGKFSVTPVVPLPAADYLTAKPRVLDTEYLLDLSNPRSIKLSWDKVRNADEYNIRVLNSKGKLLASYTTTDSSFDLEWMNVISAQKNDRDRDDLYKGTFTWTVEAIRKIDTDDDGVKDTVLQSGNLASATFETNVPKPEKTKGKGAANAYSTR